MKNNTRCVPVAKSDKYPEGLIKFNICSSCPCFNSEWDECVLLNVAINFRDFFGSIHKDCPLFLYDRIREHGPNEIPKNNDFDEYPECESKTVLCKLKASSRYTQRTRIVYCQGRYDAEDGKWYFLYDLSTETVTLESWTYLPEEER